MKERRESVRFFTRFLLISVLSVVVIIISLAIVTKGAFLGYAALLLVAGNILVLFFMFFKSIAIFIKHIFDKTKRRFEFLYIFNIFFSLGVLGLYLFFYLLVAMSVLIVLLPFLDL